MKYFYDTEFLEDGQTIDLISIGIVAEDGREYYAVNSDLPIERIRGNDWLLRNVMPSLPVTGKSSLDAYVANPSNFHPRPSAAHVDVDRRNIAVKPKWVIANEVREFLLAYTQPELWAWFGAYDHVALAQLYGKMINLPTGVPMFTNDVRSLTVWTGVDDLPEQADGVHNALADARHVKTMHDHIISELKRRGKP